jgi:pyrroline-5-carboxylate reductase
VKKTVAFIGFQKHLLDFLSKLLSAGYPVLVADQHIIEEVYTLKATIASRFPDASLELHTCSKECAWASDIVILSVELNTLQNLCANIKNVVTGKIVVTSENQAYYEQMKALFPYSKVVWINKEHIFSEDLLALEKITEILHQSHTESSSLVR